MGIIEHLLVLEVKLVNKKRLKELQIPFFLLPNGNYVFVEITTDISTKDKLSNDILACFNFKKSKIPINKIEEIILCINWNLSQKEILKLNQLVKRYNNHSRVSYLMLQELAIDLHFHHRDLVHEYLGLPLDTGQIVSMEKFIDEYNRASKGISTPIDNTFLHRENELDELKESIQSSDFIILTGAPGVGKTKLALEGIKSFLAENLGYDAYCVSYKNHTLLDDLFQYLDTDKDYILFVDDANRIDAFSQVTGFYQASRKGKLKVVITVRDYAFQEIGILCQEFAPKRIDLMKFSDEQIIEIIKLKPFEILNPDYHKEIVRIADGNPRLAIMTSLLAKAEQNIYALRDVSDLFENYFSTFIKDDGEFASNLNIKCLGLIAFFYTIPYKDKKIVSSILAHFEIDYSSFIDAIDKLDKLELVEIQFEHVKIPEQNLSTYFFYKAFIKDNLLSFEVLLSNYFDSNSSRFKDCVIPANNTFGVQNVMDKLRPYLQNHWKSIKNDEEKGFKFLSAFWYYLSTESLAFIYGITESLERPTSESYEVTYENNAFSYEKNNVIELLGEFFRFPDNLKDALELAVEYVLKKPEHLPELIHKIREQLSFDRDDERFRFSRQSVLFQILLDGLNKGDNLCTTIFYELSKTFLSFKFRHTKGGRNHSFYWYEYPIPNSREIQEFRKHIWVAVANNFNNSPTESLNLLQSYASVSPDVLKDVMEFDVPYVIDIIERHLSPDSFEHCRYVHEQIRWCKRNSVSSPSFSSLAESFTNADYETYLKIDWDRLRDKEMYEYDDYREYERLKEGEIRTSFVFKTSTEVEEFIKVFTFLKEKAKNEWNYNNSLDFVIDENCNLDFQLGCELLKEVISIDNTINYIPRVVFRNHLKTAESSEHIWRILRSKEFNLKAHWELSFYDYLDDSLLSKDYIDAIVNTVSNMSGSNTVHFDRLQRFLSIEPNLFQVVLRKIVEKNEIGIGLQVWMDFFSTHYDKLGDDIDLIKKAYIQQDKIHNHFDYEGKGMFNILKQDARFILEYVESLYSERKFGFSGDHRKLGFVWQIDGIEPVLTEVFDLVIEREPYLGILDHFCNSFFRNVPEVSKEKAKDFLFQFVRANNSDHQKVNVAVDIARHSMKEVFEEMLLLFLSINQDIEVFSKIMWRGSGTSGTGDVILADIEAADWRNILGIVNNSQMGTKLIPIKKYLNERIESCLRSGDWERQRRFLERY